MVRVRRLCGENTSGGEGGRNPARGTHAPRSNWAPCRWEAGLRRRRALQLAGEVAAVWSESRTLSGKLRKRAVHGRFLGLVGFQDWTWSWIPPRDGLRVAFVGRERLQRETASAAALSREHRGLLAEPGWMGSSDGLSVLRWSEIAAVRAEPYYGVAEQVRRRRGQSSDLGAGGASLLPFRSSATALFSIAFPEVAFWCLPPKCLGEEERGRVAAKFSYSPRGWKLGCMSP